MNARRALVLLVAILALPRLSAAQEKQLSVDDIYDPVRRVDFNGVVPDITWLPDGRSYLLTNADPRRGAVGLRKVDVSSGRDEPFLDTGRFERALGAIAGIAPAEAHEIATST